MEVDDSSDVEVVSESLVNAARRRNRSREAQNVRRTGKRRSTRPTPSPARCLHAMQPHGTGSGPTGGAAQGVLTASMEPDRAQQGRNVDVLFLNGENHMPTFAEQNKHPANKAVQPVLARNARGRNVQDELIGFSTPFRSSQLGAGSSFIPVERRVSSPVSQHLKSDSAILSDRTLGEQTDAPSGDVTKDAHLECDRAFLNRVSHKPAVPEQAPKPEAMQTATPMAQKVETTFSFKEVQWMHVTKHGILCLHCMALSRNGLIPDEAVLRILHVCAQRQQKVVHDDQLVELDKHRRAACMRLYGVECIPLTVQQEFNDNIRDVISLEQDPTVRLKIPGFYPPIHACDTNVGAKFSHQARSECTQADLDAVPDAPTFYPSEAEFADPAKYLTLVSALAKQFGICKIVPPDSWHRRKGASKVSREWNIKTCIQPIHELMHRDEKKNNTFAYEESEMCTVRKFEEAANVYQQLFLQQHYSSQCSGSGTMPESPSSPHSPRSRVAQNFGEQLAFYEKKYWDIVSGAPSSLWPTQPQPMYTLYANDMDSNTVYDVNLEYGGPRPRSDPWNLNTLSQSNRMLLSFVARFCTDVNLSGVAQPWIYFGMLFSTFCWHTEDNYLFSINCLHEGSSKFWYGVPGWGPQQPELAFERAFYSVHSQKAKHDHANILYDLRTMISPAQLREHNVPVYRLVQHAGEIVVTLPHAYHSGFSTGFNCAEAVNFALPCWFVYGVRSETRYKKWRKEPVFSTQLLMYLAFRANGDAALRDMMISKTELTYIQDQFACVIENERVQRAECRKLGLVSRSEHLIQDDAVNRVCMHCQQPCDFSAVRIVLPISDDSDSGASSSRVGKSTTTSRASYLCLEHALRFRDFEGEGELAEYVTLQELESVLVRMRTYVADARPPLTVGARTFSHNGVLGVTPKSDRVCLACVSSAAGTDVRGKITDPPWESSFGVQELLREVLERP